MKRIEIATQILAAMSAHVMSTDKETLSSRVDSALVLADLLIQRSGPGEWQEMLDQIQELEEEIKELRLINSELAEFANEK